MPGSMSAAFAAFCRPTPTMFSAAVATANWPPAGTQRLDLPADALEDP